MLKPCSVVYFPGVGGNFIKYCLSLSPEIVPYYTQDLDTVDDSEVDLVYSLTAQQRKNLIEFRTVEDFRKLHFHPGTHIVEPNFFYHNSKVNQHYKWTLVFNHPDNYRTRLPWLKKIIYIELDLKKYGHWIKNASSHFRKLQIPFGNFSQDDSYQLSLDQIKEQQEIRELPITTTVDMTRILDNQQGFELEYLSACQALEITPVLDTALQYYQDWRHLRVDPFI